MGLTLLPHYILLLVCVCFCVYFQIKLQTSPPCMCVCGSSNLWNFFDDRFLAKYFAAYFLGLWGKEVLASQIKVRHHDVVDESRDKTDDNNESLIRRQAKLTVQGTCNIIKMIITTPLPISYESMYVCVHMAFLLVCVFEFHY